MSRFYNIDLNQEQVDVIEYALRHLQTTQPELFAHGDFGAGEEDGPGCYLPEMFGDLKNLPDEETGSQMTHGFCI